MTQYLRKVSTADELPGAVGTDCSGNPMSALRPAGWTIYALYRDQSAAAQGSCLAAHLCR